MKLSPFFQVKKFVEDEIFNLALELQLQFLAGSKLSDQYCIGYRVALSHVLSKILSIEHDLARGALLQQSLTPDDNQALEAFLSYALAKKEEP